ncbi:MAG: hypothetical protein KKD25_11995, partial [Gammaproteobacteria bacterium]|nr:hypothetical protein [Gammaproteobacteria bacterium]MBU1845240.1 hypothetical protein [Gammaproteobacteria bacterium]
MNLNDLKVQAIWAADTQSGRDAAVDVSAVDITLDNPLRVKDALTIANPVGNNASSVGGGTNVSAEDGQSTHVSTLTTGATLDVTVLGVGNV